MFKIATFNANSVRSRLEIILVWIARNKPDVLCVQETKCQDADFPKEAFEREGLHVAFKGEKSYNGVAIISRSKPEGVKYGFDDGGPADEARLLRARIAGVDVVNTYVPQGQDVESPVFKYKIEWFARLRRLFEKEYSPEGPLVWCGDLNVAPGEMDVYDPKRLAGGVCFHPDEQAALAEVMKWGLADVFRRHNSEGGQFTFWDYRIPDSVKRKLGWRLDHIMATRATADKSVRAWIDKEPRLMDRPSDHTFLVAEFEL